jgi:hypothetical protein
MKPINLITYGVGALLVLAGIVVTVGLIERKGILVLMGTVTFLIACVASCIPLGAVGAVAAWNNVSRWSLCARGRRRVGPTRKSTKKSPLGE